jgi:hypothetical protein
MEIMNYSKVSEDLTFLLKEVLANNKFNQELGANARATIKGSFDILSTVNKTHGIYKSLHYTI